LGKLADKQSEQLLRIMSMKPAVRKNHIQEQVNALAQDSAEMLKQIGLQVDTRFPEIPARVLQAPNIAYGGGAQVRMNFSSRMNLIHHTFYCEQKIRDGGDTYYESCEYIILPNVYNNL
jgi:hypothetical protein